MIGSMSVQQVAQDTILNFVVTGDVRSGAGVVQSCLAHTPATVCHGELLFDGFGTVEEQDDIRRSAHEDYFGPCHNLKFKEWFVAGESNPCQYLNDMVFDNPQCAEDRIGIRLNYSHLHRYELYDLLAERWREGDFCVVHVIRNPIACLISLRQAQRSGVWCDHASSPVQAASSAPPPVSLEPQEVIDHVRWHESVRGKIRANCADTLEITYRDLCLNYKKTMQKVFTFLELPQQEIPIPSYRRLPNRDTRNRIFNYQQLMKELPSGVRCYLNEDLY